MGIFNSFAPSGGGGGGTVDIKKISSGYTIIGSTVLLFENLYIIPSFWWVVSLRDSYEKYLTQARAIYVDCNGHLVTHSYNGVTDDYQNPESSYSPRFITAALHPIYSGKFYIELKGQTGDNNYHYWYESGGDYTLYYIE